MNLLIIDVESTCDTVNVRDTMEIIELGCVMVSENGNVLSEFQTFVKPVVHPVLTDFCKELTHIQQEDVCNAPAFAAALTQLTTWADSYKPYVFSSWGYYDKNQILLDCARAGVVFPLGEKHINLKNEYARIKKTKRMGIKHLIDVLGWEWEGTLHRGICDARNMARVAKLIIGELK